MDWIWRVGMVLLIAGQYWVQTNFVPRSEFLKEKAAALTQYQAEKDASMRQYQEDKKVWWDRLSNLSSTINSLDLAVRLSEANKSILSDHESRIRDLERRRGP